MKQRGASELVVEDLSSVQSRAELKASEGHYGDEGIGKHMVSNTPSTGIAIS